MRVEGLGLTEYKAMERMRTSVCNRIVLHMHMQYNPFSKVSTWYLLWYAPRHAVLFVARLLMRIYIYIYMIYIYYIYICVYIYIYT